MARSAHYFADDRNLLLLALVFGTCFGTLVLYANSFVTIGLVLLVVTAAVFLGSREDLKGLAANRQFIVVIVVVAGLEVLGALLILPEAGGYLFELLLALSLVLLIAYSINSRASRAQEKWENYR